MTLPLWLTIVTSLTVVFTIYTFGSDGLWYIVLIAGIFIFIGSIGTHTSVKEGAACRKAGGVWISRDSQCVQPIPYEKPK